MEYFCLMASRSRALYLCDRGNPTDFGHANSNFGGRLGHQLLGLASGLEQEKMKFGHHGANHPVQDLETGLVMITSQNHGFAIDEVSLPSNLE